jgi:hypothetical protein
MSIKTLSCLILASAIMIVGASGASASNQSWTSSFSAMSPNTSGAPDLTPSGGGAALKEISPTNGFMKMHDSSTRAPTDKIGRSASSGAMIDDGLSAGFNFGTGSPPS